MAKKQKVDFSNPKIAAVIKTMAIAEGRLSRDSIYKIGSKDILYQLKNSGYIEKSKTDKSVFVATERLKKASKANFELNIVKGCSNGHAEVIAKALRYIPNEVAAQGRFSTGDDLRKDFSRLKNTPQVVEKLAEMKNELCERRLELLSQCVSAPMENIIGIQSQVDGLDREISVLESENACFIPDFSITISQEEAADIISSFEERMEEIGCTDREMIFLQENIEKLSCLDFSGGAVSICIEAVTNSYGEIELIRHENYDILTDSVTLYIA